VNAVQAAYKSKGFEIANIQNQSRAHDVKRLFLKKIEFTELHQPTKKNTASPCLLLTTPMTEQHRYS
jgi:hypothetical protein